MDRFEDSTMVVVEDSLDKVKDFIEIVEDSLEVENSKEVEEFRDTLSSKKSVLNFDLNLPTI